jgi:formate-dependent nitrite reductase membrane component NrfD
MIEITLVGENGVLSSWGWEIAVYLFLGGLTAGLMIISGVMRLTRKENFPKALFISDVLGFPILALGMVFLFLDLSNKLNVWRFYTTFKGQSAMSWGAWLLLITMVWLLIRLVSRTPQPKNMRILGMELFPPPPDPQDEETAAPQKRPWFARLLEWKWTALDKIARWGQKIDRLLAIIGIPLGIGIGFYTGILLSTIPARPLWNTAILAPLFLVSGLAGAGAFLCLFITPEEHHKLVMPSVLFCTIELIFLISFAINLGSGTDSVERAGDLLLKGGFGWVFWGVVVILGLIVPAVVETFDLAKNPIKSIPGSIPPVLKLVGGLALRIVIVYAGLLSFI